MDARELRNVFGSFVTGVTVITTTDAHGVDQGVTANSFSSVSLDPPLVLWSQARSARSFSAFQSADHFIVNILAEQQRELSQRFASAGVDKFQGLDVQRRLNGLPALPGCCAYVECRKVAEYPGSDHLVYLGEVLAVERHDRRPLAFARGKYMMAFEHEMNRVTLDGDSAYSAHHEVVRMACAALPEITSHLDASVGLAVWGNRGATIVRWETAASGQASDLRTGIVVSPLTSATGLLFNAILPRSMTDPVTNEAFDELKLLGADKAAARDQHEAQLQSIRAQGFANSRQSALLGRAGISAPVYDAGGHLVLALSAVANPSDSPARIEALSVALRAAAQALSARLGGKQSVKEIA
jgi:flavin reductase (DIM6/NTAB) family NADH-FMN oxidoreductase RutF